MMATTITRRLRYAMVGGGRDAFIGAVHRMAARLDDRIVLVAGALSSDPERARLSGADVGLAPERCYASYAEMAAAEAGSQPMKASTSPRSSMTEMSVILPGTRWNLMFCVFST